MSNAGVMGVVGALTEGAVPCPHPERDSRMYLMDSTPKVNLCMRCFNVLKEVMDGRMSGADTVASARDRLAAEDWDDATIDQFLTDIDAYAQESANAN